MTRIGFSAVLLVLLLCSPLQAQNANALNDLKAKIFDRWRSGILRPACVIAAS
jgi:hypothetical protein